jgi:non-specific serine/threonine protein kinase
VGARAPGAVGKDALLDFSSTVTLDGEPLTEAELAELLAGSDGLRLLRGRWIELDRVELRATLERLRAIERAAAGGGVGFAEAMRLVAGAAVTGDSELAAATHARGIAGPWLAETLARLRSPEGSRRPSRAPTCTHSSGRTRPWAYAGCTCSRSSVSARASPTIWASARPSR